MQQNIYTEGGENRYAKSSAPNSFSVWLCNILLTMPSVAKILSKETKVVSTPSPKILMTN